MSTQTVDKNELGYMDVANDIRQLNDLFRTSDGDISRLYGKKLITQGIMALGLPAVVTIAQKVQAFDQFDQDNDPHGEHDFGAFDHDGERIFWKIDYYDATYEAGSPDPTDAGKTRRVLTIMLASEY